MPRLIAALLCLLTTLPAAALEVTQRNDLAPRLSALRSLYNDNWQPDDQTFANATIFYLSGPIERGDTEKVRAALETTWGKYIVFDSPGGSFLEGIALGNYVTSIMENQDPDIYGVFVLKDGPCLSACALAVALSTSTRDISEGRDYRYIEHGARLGFHMGLLPEAQATQSVQAREMMNLTYDITQAYTSLIMGGVAPPILLAEALEHRDADSFFVLGGGVRTHAMRMTPVGPAHMARAIDQNALTMDTVERLCFGAFLAEPTVPRSFVDYEFGEIRGLGQDTASFSLADFTASLGSRRIAASHNGAAHCQVELRDDGSVGLRVSPRPLPCDPGDAAWCAVRDTDTPLPNASVAMLADAFGCHSGRLTRETVYWGADLYGVANSPNQFPSTRKIARAVNMRDAPSLTAARVGSLDTGAEVNLRDCAIVDGPQGVWMQVEAGGRTGWISARFLDPYGLWDQRPYRDGP